MQAKLISIIIPCFNAFPFIKKTLESALNQTYPYIEIIVIDNGSTDGSWEYLKSVNLSNVIVLRSQIKGASFARNYGLKIARGDYIQFLDADDLLSADKIEKQMIQLVKHDENTIATCGWVHFDTEPNTNFYHPQEIDKSYSNPIDWLVDSFNGGGMGQTAIWLLPKTLILRAGFWNTNLKDNPNDDGEFFCRVLCLSSVICFVDGVFVYYRRPRDSNLSNIKTRIAIDSLLKSYKLYEVILQWRNDVRTKKSLAKNYINFIYIYYNIYPELAQNAEDFVLELGQEMNIPFSNKLIKFLSAIFGWKKVLFLRKLIKGY